MEKKEITKRRRGRPLQTSKALTDQSNKLPGELVNFTRDETTITIPVYQAGEVCRLTGVSYRQLDYWARSGLWLPSIAEGLGHGSVRLYGMRDLVAIRLIKLALSAGLTLRRLHNALAYLWEKLPYDPADFNGLVFATDGEKSFVLSSDPAEISKAIYSDALIFTAGCTALLQDLGHEANEEGWEAA